VESSRTASDTGFMLRALDCARLGLGHTVPNPPVGALIVRGTRVLAEGHHAKAGGPHAEIVALSSLRGSAKGATVYVTLEPCSHHGKTPPCTTALIAAKPKRVVIGCRDPNPRVAGRGIRALRAAGIQVDVGAAEAECQDLIRGFDVWIRTGMPRVELKLATSLDGRIATRSGASKWISSPASRRRVQQMRARANAVLVGIGTVLADDPRLTCRVAGAAAPLRIVLDRRLRTPPKARVVRERRGGCLIVCAKNPGRAEKRRLESAGAEVLEVAAGKGAAWQPLLRELGLRGVHEVLIEGGGVVAASALAARVVHGATFFYNPRVIGGDGIPMIGSLGVEHPDAALSAVTRTWSMSGSDLVWEGEFV
jgi:diaminohydroxyphosphoribosylaminopyrimidine deaminase/5-amino-6-(5-phosphoribosylamino)uracil reductase